MGPLTLLSLKMTIQDKHTTNFFLPDGSYGTVANGDYSMQDGAHANLVTGDYVFANGSSTNIYAQNAAHQPNMEAVTLPTQNTFQGSGIAASTLGLQVSVLTADISTTMAASALQGSIIVTVNGASNTTMSKANSTASLTTSKSKPIATGVGEARSQNEGVH